MKNRIVLSLLIFLAFFAYCIVGVGYYMEGEKAKCELLTGNMEDVKVNGSDFVNLEVPYQESNEDLYSDYRYCKSFLAKPVWLRIAEGLFENLIAILFILLGFNIVYFLVEEMKVFSG